MISNISQMYLKWTSNVSHQISKWIRTLDVGWLHGFILILSSTLSCFCKEIWTFGVGWLQTSANFLETVFGQFVRHFTIVTSLPPPSIMSEGGRFGSSGGGTGWPVSYVLLFFIPPSLNVKTLGFGFWRWGGPRLQLAWPQRSNSEGAKLQSTFLERPPACN